MTASYSLTMQPAFSGSLTFDIKKQVQATLGYNFTKGETFQISKTSKPLKVGEYVIAYYQKMYKVTPVNQERTVRTYGYETVNGVSRPVDYTKREVTTAYAKQAILPDISLDYKMASGKSGRSLYQEDKTVRTETYHYVDGSYQLINVEVFE